MGLIRVAALLLPLIWAACLLTKRRALACAPLVLLGVAAGGYLLALFSAAWAGVWILRVLWLAACGWIALSLLRRGRDALPDGTLLLLAAGLVFLWWIDRGRQYTNWDDFSHWGMAVKSLFSEGRLVSLTAGSGDFFPAYPPSLAPFIYLCLRAVGYGFREDLTLFLQSVFLLGLLLYPLQNVSLRKNPLAACGGAALLVLCPLILYANSYITLTVDPMLGILGAFLVWTALQESPGRLEVLLAGLCAFVLAGAVKASGIAFALGGALLFALLYRMKNKALPRGRRAAGALAPLCAAAAGKLSWNAFLTLYGIADRWSGGGFSWQSLWQLISRGEPEYRVFVLKKFFVNVAGDFNYGSLLHFPYLAWLVLLALLFWPLVRLTVPQKAERRAARIAFWGTWGFAVLFMLGMLSSYLFTFSQLEAVALASLSRYLNSPMTMLILVMAGLLCQALAACPVRRQAAGLLAGALFWALAASPSAAAPLADIAAAPTRAAQSINYNRSYRMIADYIAQQTPQDADICNMLLVSQGDYGFAYIALNYQIFPAVLPDQDSSVTLRSDAPPEYIRYDTPQAWAAEVGQSFSYVCLHNIDDTFAEDFGVLFDAPDKVANGSIFKVETRADGTVGFTFVTQLDW